MGSLVLWSYINGSSNGVFNISPSLSGTPVFSVNIPNKTITTGGRVTINDEGLVLNRSIGNGYVTWQNGSGVDAWALQRHEANGSLVLWTAGSAANGQFKIANALSGNPVFMVDVPSALTTVSGNLTASGKIGIGNVPASASGALSIKAANMWESHYDNTIELLGSSSAANSPTIHFKPATASNSAWISAPIGGGLQFGVDEDDAQGTQTGKMPIIITAGSNVALASNAGGQVIVGGLNPNPTAGVKLDVEGGARVSGTLIAQTVMTNSWGVNPPDYVFEDDYKLSSLEQVDDFVKKNKHLPEVPSAKQIKDKGLDLAEMNLVLLKKVEELTLHAIRQERELKRQAEEIRRLKHL
jgi:hypothetical protein